MQQIVEIDYEDSKLVARLAAIAYEAFKETAPNWLANQNASTELVLAGAGSNRFGNVYFRGDIAVGWVGVILRRHVWEIHPIAVDPRNQEEGVGRKLVEGIAERAKAAGVATLLAATSDETGTTNLFGKDLYQDPALAITEIEIADRSPLAFWRSVGFTVVGIVPDEEGPGKPGIHLARKL